MLIEIFPHTAVAVAAHLRLVNCAKWLLIGQLGMTEADAHRWLEKQAMDRCVSRRSVAEEIIRNCPKS